MNTLNLQISDYATICNKWATYIAEMSAANEEASQTTTAKRIRHCLENPCAVNRYYIEQKTYVNFAKRNGKNFNPYTYSKKRRSSTFL